MDSTTEPLPQTQTESPRRFASLDDIVRGCLSAHSELFWAKGVRLVQQLPREQIYVMDDLGALRQGISTMLARALRDVRLWDVLTVRLVREGPVVRFEIVRGLEGAAGADLAGCTETAQWFTVPCFWSEKSA